MRFLHRLATAPLGMLAASVAALATSAAAQEVAPAPIQASPQSSTPRDAGEPLITLQKKDISVRDLLSQIDDVFPQKILVGEGVIGTIRLITLKDKSLTQALDRLCLVAGLTWGNLDGDTIVVLPARKTTSVVPDLKLIPAPVGPLFRVPSGKSFTLPLIPGAPLAPSPRLYVDPRHRLHPAPELEQRLERAPRNASPRQFNGETYYVIPLRPEAAPEPQTYEQPAQPQ